MSRDECRIVEVDGEPVRALFTGEPDQADLDAFAEIVRAARRRFERELGERS